MSQLNEPRYKPPRYIMNTVNNIAQSVGARMRKPNIQHTKEIKLDNIGSSQHEKILKYMQSQSKLPTLLPLKKGNWDFHHFFANGMFITPSQDRMADYSTFNLIIIGDGDYHLIQHNLDILMFHLRIRVMSNDTNIIFIMEYAIW